MLLASNDVSAVFLSPRDLWWCLFIVLIATHVNAESPIPPISQDPLEDQFAFRGIIYQQDDPNGTAGNPHIDEDVFVYEGIWLYRKKLNERNAFEGKFSGDIVSAASYDDAKDEAEVVSGATGYNPGRFEIQLGVKHQRYDWGVYAHSAYGQEYAYRSSSLQFGGNKSFAEQSTQVTANISLYDDLVRVIRFDGVKESDENRSTTTLNLGLTQTLTPFSVMNLAWSHTRQNGFLATSFNAVKVADDFEYEIVPNQRLRNGVSARYKHAIKQNSWQLGYSYYWDDWGIDASVVELRYWANLHDRRTVIEPMIRYYTQTSADFFAADFASPQTLQTSDSDLGDFYGHLLGTNLSFYGSNTLLKKPAWYDLGFHYYQRSDGIDFYWLTLGWRSR